MQMIGHYNTMVEKETSEGRIDCVVEWPEYVYVMEFKKDGSAQSALEQIRERGYTKPYLADKRKVFSIGVNFSSEKGTIEEYVFEWALRVNSQQSIGLGIIAPNSRLIAFLFKGLRV